jgi:hypothetical protein
MYCNGTAMATPEFKVPENDVTFTSMMEMNHLK